MLSFRLRKAIQKYRNIKKYTAHQKKKQTNKQKDKTISVCNWRWVFLFYKNSEDYGLFYVKFSYVSVIEKKVLSYHFSQAA